MYANIMISISRSVWEVLSPDARESFQSLLSEFMRTMGEEIERWDGPITNTNEMVTFSANAFVDQDDEESSCEQL